MTGLIIKQVERNSRVDIIVSVAVKTAVWSGSCCRELIKLIEAS